MCTDSIGLTIISLFIPQKILQCAGLQLNGTKLGSFFGCSMYKTVAAFKLGTSWEWMLDKNIHLHAQQLKCALRALLNRFLVRRVLQSGAIQSAYCAAAEQWHIPASIYTMNSMHIAQYHGRGRDLRASQNRHSANTEASISTPIKHSYSDLYKALIDKTDDQTTISTPVAVGAHLTMGPTSRRDKRKSLKNQGRQTGSCGWTSHKTPGDKNALRRDQTQAWAMSQKPLPHHIRLNVQPNVTWCFYHQAGITLVIPSPSPVNFLPFNQSHPRCPIPIRSHLSTWLSPYCPVICSISHFRNKYLVANFQLPRDPG